MLEVAQELGKAVIKVVGVGGGGNNAVNRMIESGISGVEFIAINTDAQILVHSKAATKIQIGEKLTKGLGAGGNPEVGEAAAVESREAIIQALKGADLIFVTAGMGGGTGTGAAPIVAECAKELGSLVVAVITKPFKFEGIRRMRQATDGIAKLKTVVDSAVIIPNEKLRAISDKKTSLVDSFRMADISLTNGVEGLVNLIVKPGLINLDFADIRTVMQNSGSALMGVGIASGENAVETAARAALNSPFLETAIEEATGAVMCFAGSEGILTLNDVMEAGEIVREYTSEEANVIFGAITDDSLGDSIKVTIVITGFADEAKITDALDGATKPKAAKEVKSESTEEATADAKTVAEEKPVESSTDAKGDAGFIRPGKLDIPEIPKWLRRNN